METPPKERDRQLWRALRRGEETALSKLFLTYSAELASFGYLLCGDQQVVEDSIQDLFMRLWKNRGKLSSVDNVKAYLFTALRNSIQDWYRKKKFTPAFSLSVPENLPSADALLLQSSVEDDWIREEQRQLQREALSEWLNTLPERMKQVIYLRYSSGLNYQEIAQVMDIRPQSAMNMAHRAAQKLKSYAARYTERFLIFLSGGLLFFVG